MESPYIGKSQHAKDRPEWPANLRSNNKRVIHRRPSDTLTDSMLDSEVRLYSCLLLVFIDSSCSLLLCNTQCVCTLSPVLVLELSFQIT